MLNNPQTLEFKTKGFWLYRMKLETGMGQAGGNE